MARRWAAAFNFAVGTIFSCSNRPSQMLPARAETGLGSRFVLASSRHGLQEFRNLGHLVRRFRMSV
eukprot:1851836-Pleurochrysis_carterae.AAC.1